MMASDEWVILSLFLIQISVMFLNIIRLSMINDSLWSVRVDFSSAKDELDMLTNGSLIQVSSIHI